MHEWSTRWQELMRELEEERDALRVRLHLAKAEAREELAELEGKLEALKAQVRAVDTRGDGYLDDIGDAARQMAAELGEEVREGLEKLRRRL